MALTTNSNHTVLRGGGQGGHLYDGIEPIVVNNQEYKISANTAALGVESPLYFSVDTSSQTVISFSGDAQPYSAGENISVENHVISGRDWSPELAEKLDITALESLDVTEYSAGDNINISNHIVSGKDWNPEINNASSYAYSEAVIDMLKFPSAVDNITPNIVTGYILDSELHLSGRDWSDDITAASANAYNEAVNNITAVKSADSATYDNLGREITSTYLTAEVEYSAGQNIDITDHIVSGKDWTSEIQSASSYAYDQATAQIPAVTGLPYVENSALADRKSVV